MAGNMWGINDPFEEMRRNQADILRSVMPDISSPIQDFMESHADLFAKIIDTETLRKNLARSYSPLTEEWAKSITGSITSRLSDLTGVNADWAPLVPWDRFAAIAETVAESGSSEFVWEEAEAALPEVARAVDDAVDEWSQSSSGELDYPVTDYHLRVAGFFTVLMTMGLAILVLEQYLPPEVAEVVQALLAAYGLISFPRKQD